MTIELHADDLAVADAAPARTSRALGESGRPRPDLPDDLSTVLESAPMFRRALAGYDRFQVDSYVRWAEDELAAADREREHLVARQLETRAALDEARELLTHSAGGGEFLQLSRRIGALLATAADEADAMRAEADADRRAAAAELEQAALDAKRVVAEATTAADRTLADARAAADAMLEHARLVVAAAEATAARARDEAAQRLAGVRELEQRATDDAVRTRQQAADEIAAARLQARAEILGMLAAGREERRRADAEASAARRRLVSGTR